MKGKQITKALLLGSLMSSFTGLALNSTMALVVEEETTEVLPIPQEKRVIRIQPGSRVPSAKIAPTTDGFDVPFESGPVPESITFERIGDFKIITTKDEFQKLYGTEMTAPDFSQATVVIYNAGNRKRLGDEIKIQSIKALPIAGSDQAVLNIVYTVEQMAPTEGGIQNTVGKPLATAFIIAAPANKISTYQFSQKGAIGYQVPEEVVKIEKRRISEYR